jgi:hypothetical protein
VFFSDVFLSPGAFGGLVFGRIGIPFGRVDIPVLSPQGFQLRPFDIVGAQAELVASGNRVVPAVVAIDSISEIIDNLQLLVFIPIKGHLPVSPFVESRLLKYGIF